MTFPSFVTKGLEDHDLPGFEPILLEEKTRCGEPFKTGWERKKRWHMISWLLLGLAVLPTVDGIAVPAWEGADGPLCRTMNHTPVMGDTHKHESNEK